MRGLTEQFGRLIHHEMNTRLRSTAALQLAVVALLVSCGGNNDDVPPFGTDPDPLPIGTLRVVFSDVGQADAILIQLGDVDIVVDAGTSGLSRTTSNLITDPIELLFISTSTIPHHTRSPNSRVPPD